MIPTNIPITWSGATTVNVSNAIVYSDPIAVSRMRDPAVQTLVSAFALAGGAKVSLQGTLDPALGAGSWSDLTGYSFTPIATGGPIFQLSSVSLLYVRVAFTPGSGTATLSGNAQGRQDA